MDMIHLNDGTPIATKQYNILYPCTDKIPISFETSLAYDEYVLCSLAQIYRDNLFFYQIPQGFKVYSHQAVMTDHDTAGARFYVTASNLEGDFTHEYQFTRPVDLVALNMDSNINVLLATAIQDERDDVIRILTQHSGNYVSILDYLCTMDFTGYVAKNEAYIMYICQPQQVVKKISNI